MSLPTDFEETVYAGVLGKIIGVYLGRPFEGWEYRRILAELGPINYYVHQKLGVPLVVTDDDITGTFTFMRAMADYGYSPELTPAQIGQTWLNYLIEERTILWWGGLGNSTEHTAYLRLKDGVPAPRSGSIALNSKVVAEQIGAQIFIDGWAMLCPGDPALAADLARRAASVSHDGEAVLAAQVIAVLEAAAFVEKDLDRLLDIAVGFIPVDSTIYRLIADLRKLRRTEPDWERARQFIEDEYGYRSYGGGVHVVPNHALIMLALLWGDDDFQKSLMIVNTAGWDTDCNSGNLGCILGIKNGLRGIDGGPDFRGPVADQMFLPTADGGGAITDAVRQTVAIVNVARVMRGLEPVRPKEGARFSFHLPGSVQAFRESDDVDSRGVLSVENAEIPTLGVRALALRFRHLAPGRPGRVETPTFVPASFAQDKLHYELLASPTLHPGQQVTARVVAGMENNAPVRVGLFLRHYDGNDRLDGGAGPTVSLAAGEESELGWRIPGLGGQPVASIGIAIAAELPGSSTGTIYLDRLTWDGTPEVVLGRPADGGTLWRKAWVNAVDHYGWRYPETYRLMQNHGTGLLIQGGRDWQDYAVEALISPHMAAGAGVAARVQGMGRYYALVLGADQRIRLVKMLDQEEVLAECDLPFEWDCPMTFRIEVEGARLRAGIDGATLFDVEDRRRPLHDGGVALVAQEGRIAAEWVKVLPLNAGKAG